MKTLLGIDIGTSATKAILIRGDGSVHGSQSAGHRLNMPRPGWTEQDPVMWWEATCAAVSGLLAQAGVHRQDVAAIGLSGQMHGSVLLDSGAVSLASVEVPVPLRPAILWNDQRTAKQCAFIEAAAGGRSRLVQVCGNAAVTGFTLPKLLWVREHEPDCFARASMLLLPKDYVRLCLTGVAATDVGDASGVLLLDMARRNWSRALCDAVGIDPALLPPVLESAAVSGALSPFAARQLGLMPGIPVVAGSGDNQCGAVGSGVVEPGVLACTLGTSGVLIAPCDSPVVDAARGGRTHTMCAATGTATTAGNWCMTGCLLSAGGSLRWCRETLFPDQSYEQLLEEASQAPAGCGGLIFLPHLTGERCPHADPMARGAWIGLTARHRRGHLVRAILEGVALSMSQILDIMQGLGVPAARVRASGGGVRSRLWKQILADSLGLPVTTTGSEEGPAFGAALLAGVGAGIWNSVPEACRATVRDVERIEPTAEGLRWAECAKPVFQPAYSELRARFTALAALDS